jgi:hypothetical protein
MNKFRFIILTIYFTFAPAILFANLKPAYACITTPNGTSTCPEGLSATVRKRTGFYSHVGMRPPGIIYLWPSPWDGGKTDVWCDVPNHTMYVNHLKKIGSAIEVKSLASVKESANYWSRSCSDDVFQHPRVQH